MRGVSDLGVQRVHHRGDPGSEEGDAARVLRDGPVRLLPDGGVVGVGGHGAVHHRHVDAGLLPHVASLHDAGDAAAEAVAGPGVLAELGAVDFLDGRADGVLGLADGLLKAAAHPEDEQGRREREMGEGRGDT